MKLTQVFLYLQKAGKESIKIIDNGVGMSLQDAKLCFVPHATSKIEKLDDLEKIISESKKMQDILKK